MSSGYSSYSEFGQKWARRIPDHWEAKRLKAIFAMRKERNNPVITNNILSLTAKQGVVPYSEKEGAGGNKPKDDMTKYNIAHENDLLVNCMNVVSGSAGVSRYYGAISPVYYALYPRNDENVWYYHYIFRLLSFQRSLIGLGKGILMHESENGKLNTVRMRISMDYLGNVLLPIPPRSEQDQIVRYLEWKVSNINKLINIQKKQVRIIEELKEKVACEALLHGIDDGVSYKASGIAWIGSIPEHWKVIKIKWLFDEADERNTDETAELLTFSKKRGLIPFSEASEKKPSASDLSNYKLLHIGQLLENRMQAWHGMFICADREGCVSPDYVALSELGYSPKLCIGEMLGQGLYFDHSWIELDGQILDIAISMTLLGCAPVSEPIVFGKNIRSGKEPVIKYGVPGRGIEGETLVVNSLPFVDYMDGFPDEKNGLWGVVQELLGRKVDIPDLREKYKDVKRAIVRE